MIINQRMLKKSYKLRIIKINTLKSFWKLRLYQENEFIELSATEFHLLEVLLSKKNKLFTREQLLSEVWGIDFDSETSVLDTYISYLRKKIHREGFSPITTVRGVGFKLVETKK